MSCFTVWRITIYLSLFAHPLLWASHVHPQNWISTKDGEYFPVGALYNTTASKQKNFQVDFLRKGSVTHATQTFYILAHRPQITQLKLNQLNVSQKVQLSYCDEDQRPERKSLRGTVMTSCQWQTEPRNLINWQMALLVKFLGNTILIFGLVQFGVEDWILCLGSGLSR